MFVSSSSLNHSVFEVKVSLYLKFFSLICFQLIFATTFAKNNACVDVNHSDYCIEFICGCFAVKLWTDATDAGSTAECGLCGLNQTQLHGI